MKQVTINTHLNAEETGCFLCRRPGLITTLIFMQLTTMKLKISRVQRLSAVIGISMSFFVAEIAGM